MHKNNNNKNASLLPLLFLFRGVLLSEAQNVQFPTEPKAIVAKFQSDGLYTVESRMMKVGLNAEEDLMDFSMCVRLRLQHLRGTYTYLVSYAYGNEDNALHVQFVKKREFILELCRLKPTNGECGRLVLKNEFKFMDWMHVCSTFDRNDVNDTHVKTSIITYKNGQELGRRNVVNVKDDVVPVAVNGTLVLGQDQDTPGGNFDDDQSFSGEMSQFGIWNRVLSNDEVLRMSSCREELISNGAIAAFGTNFKSEWEITEQVELDENVSLATLCQTPDLLDKFIQTEKVSYETFKPTCDRLGGQMPVVWSRQEVRSTHQELLETISLNLPSTSGPCMVSSKAVKVLLGQKMVDVTNKTWQDPYSGHLMDENTVDDLNSLDENEQCAYTYGTALETIDCSRLIACGVCFLPRLNNRLRLKGLCRENTAIDFDYDIDYYIYGQKNGKPFFRGIMNSDLYFDAQLQRWRLQSLRKPRKFLILTNRNPKVLPIGTHNWEIGSDVAACDKDKGEIIELTFSQCTENRYTCSSGECIDLANRCNTELDCPDKSDEQYCDYLQFGSNYANELIPRDEEGQPLSVFMNISVLAFPNIDPLNLKFTVDFFLNLRWYDLRIQFKDLNNVTALNSLSENDVDNLWTPNLAFTNALGPLRTLFDAEASGVLVREDEIPLPEDPTLSTEAMLFSGRTNAIMITREYFIDYSCDFKLRYFPFDTQMCSMVFAVQGKTDNYVQLEQDGMGIDFLGGRTLVEYEIQLETLEMYSVDNISMAEVKIVFRRRIQYYITNTFLQTFILVGVGFMSLFFDVTDFAMRVTMVLTTMLVLATIQGSIQSSLPKTSYYKLIDYWLLFSLNVQVLTMIFHTYLASKCIAVQKAQEEREKADPKDSPNLPATPQQNNGTLETITLPLENPTKQDMITEDPYIGIKRLNAIVRLAYAFLIIGFLIGFCTIAMEEFFRPAKEYL